MTPKMTRKTMAAIVVAALLASLGFGFVMYFMGQSSIADLKILVVTGEGLQETYGFYDGSHVSNGYNYYRDEFWTESTDKWSASTTYALIAADFSKKVYGDCSILLNFDTSYSSYYFYHQSRPYGYLAKEGDKWLYFNLMFNVTAQINQFEVKASDYSGKKYFSTKFVNISSYAPNEWIRFKIYMNTMAPFDAPSWSDITRLQFDVGLSERAPLKIWIDDIMMTSTYHYNLALKNLRALFKGVTLDVRDYDQLPSNIDDYVTVIYLDNRIDSVGVPTIDQYVNRGGGLVLMGLSALWDSDGTERVDFPLGASPVSILNSTETFIDNANNVDSFENHPALKPWNNYTIFTQRGYSSFRPFPYLGIAELYSVSLRTGAMSLITESGYIYEATKQYGAGKVVYFAENFAKKIANGMLEAYNPEHGKFGIRGWGGATGDRLQLLESAVNYVSKYPLPKVLMVPFAKKGGFIFTVETSAGIDQYWYLNQSCTNIVGASSNDTAFWYTVERMKNQSEETGVTFTLLIATEQLVNEFRLGHDEIEFTPRNLEALLAAYQSSNIEIGLSASNIKTWPTDAAAIDSSRQNMWQGILDLRNALTLSEYEPLVWRYPILTRRGESMYGAAQAGLYLDVSDERGSVAAPYQMEVDVWKLQDRGMFIPVIEGGEWYRKREETFFDWFVENDMIYHAFTNDLMIAADPSHIHQRALGAPNYTSTWVQTPEFLRYVNSQSENTWITGGVTLARYLKEWGATSVSATYESKSNTYTLTILNAPDGLTVRLPLNGMHVNKLESDVEYILKEQGNYAYLALKNPKSSEIVKVTLGSTKMQGIIQTADSQAVVGHPSSITVLSPLSIKILLPFSTGIRGKIETLHKDTRDKSFQQLILSRSPHRSK